MTARHIDATDKTDGSHVVKILWNENDGERELTVRMPAAGTDATDRVDVDLLPVPGEDPATTMDDAVAALEGFLGNNKYIHIDGGRRQKRLRRRPDHGHPRGKRVVDGHRGGARRTVP